MKFTVKLRSGDTHEVAQPPFADLVAFERHFGIPAPKIDEDPRAEWVAFLVWRGLRWKQVAVGEFEEFVDQIDDISFQANGDEPPGKAADQPSD